MPLRVLHIIQRLSGGGAETQVLALMEYLNTGRISPALLSIYPCERGEDVSRALSVPVIRINRAGRADIWAFPRLVRAIRQFAPDIVHTHTHSGKYWGRLAAALAGTRVIVHTDHSPCDERRTLMERVVDRILNALSTKIITFLPEQARLLAANEGISATKMAVIPNGLPIKPHYTGMQRQEARAALGIADDCFAVLIAGRLEYPKNQELAIDAMARIDPNAGEKISLLIVGAGSREPQLRERAARLSVADRVRFLGHRRDVEDLLPGADLVALTSFVEGMPMVFIEAMFAGIPVLSTPWPGAATMLGNGLYGFLTPGWKPKDVGGEILRLRRNLSLRTAVAKRAREHAVAHYDIVKTARAHRDLYGEILAKAAIPS